MPEKLLLRQDAADALGIHYMKLDRLRAAGEIPEAVQVGRYFMFPAAAMPAIKTRLTAAGHIGKKRKKKKAAAA